MRGFLPEVQALRALAVALVVVYHIWPARLPGGFIGVDVFFVISGYLITAHLMREQEATGRISLSKFWARRIRRLLPAAFTVLAASAAIAFFVLPTVTLTATLRQIAAASGYVLNWVLGFDAVDYLAADNAPTIVQHYWTLSVEEQFYIAWPVLLVVVALIVTKLRRGHGSTVAIAGWSALAVLVISLGYSVYLTWFNPSFAYFATTTRAWEFAAGGLLAAVVAKWPEIIERMRESRVVRATSLPTVLGVVVIGVASFILNDESPFPGVLAALPVVGTVLVIAGGEPRALGIGALTRWRPVQFLGDISYSVYLWHWPLLMTLVIVVGRRPVLWEGLAIVAATIALATATKYLVEDPGRRSRLLSRRGVAFAFALAGILAFTGTWVGTSTVLANQAAETARAQEARITDTSGCFGAHAVLGTAECPDPYTLSPEVDLGFAAGDYDWQNWCLTWFDEDWRTCEFGDTGSERTWALVGDSHAASLVEAFDEYFSEQGIAIETFTRFGCSGLGRPGEPVTTADQNVQIELDCLTWSERVRSELASRDDIDTVVYISRGGIYTSPDRVAPLTVDDVVATWQGVVDSGKTVISIKDWPITAGENIPECLASHIGETAPCIRPRSEAMPPDILDEAIARLGGQVESIDMTDAFCDDTTCYSVIGNVVVYPDTNHITGTYSRTLMPYLGPRLLEAAER